VIVRQSEWIPQWVSMAFHWAVSVEVFVRSDRARGTPWEDMEVEGSEEERP